MFPLLLAGHFFKAVQFGTDCVHNAYERLRLRQIDIAGLVLMHFALIVGPVLHHGDLVA